MNTRNKSKSLETKPFNVWKFTSVVILFLLGLVLSVSLWVGNTTFNILRSNLDGELVPPSRWFVSVFVPLIFAVGGLKKKSVSPSGALFGFVIGFLLTLASYLFLTCLLIFFVSSSKATKYKSKEKQKLENDFKEGGQRNWIQVLCNGGMPAFCAIFYLLDAGCGERALNFSDSFHASWLSLGVLGAFASANGDTWSSELGLVFSKSNPWLITTFKRVPKGVNGAVSLAGLLASMLGGLVVGLGYWLVLNVIVDLSLAPPQWYCIPLAATAGFIGSIIDSLLGATLQYSGFDRTKGVIVECPGKEVTHISGIGLLDNHSVNLLTTVIMGFLVPRIGYIIWPH